MRIYLWVIFGFVGCLFQACNKTEEKKPAVETTLSQAPDEGLVIYQKAEKIDSSALGIRDTVAQLLTLVYGVKIVEHPELTEDMKDGNDAVSKKIENRYDLSVSKMERKLKDLTEESDIICHVSTEGITYYQAPGRMDIDVKLVKNLRGIVGDSFKLPVEMKSGKEKTAYKIREGDDLVLFFKEADTVEGNNFIPGTNYQLISIEMVH